jgi:hypothetical protein
MKFLVFITCKTIKKIEKALYLIYLKSQDEQMKELLFEFMFISEQLQNHLKPKNDTKAQS